MTMFHRLLTRRARPGHWFPSDTLRLIDPNHRESYSHWYSSGRWTW